MNPTPEETAYSETLKKGESKVNQQNEALDHMFRCSPSIVFDKEIVTSLTEILAFHRKCKLADYNKGTAYEIAQYDDYPTVQKKIYDCLCVLDELRKRRLIDVPDFNVTFKDGDVDDKALKQYLRDLDFLSGILYSVIQTGKCEIDYGLGRVEICSATYALSDKGYDVALTLQTHADQLKQSAAQQTITSAAARAAGSSAITARRALCAAWVIGIGSVGNLLLNLWLHFCP